MALLKRKKSTTDTEKITDKNAVSVKKQEISVKKEKRIASEHTNTVLLYPLVSEKSSYAEKNATYTFVVARSVTKIAIKQAIKDLYGIAPIKVHTVNCVGKTMKFKNTAGKHSDWKKAVIFMPKGTNLEIHEGV